MRLVPDVVRLRDWPAAAWLASAAFTPPRWRSTPTTLFGWPVYLLTLTPAVVLGGAYWRDRDGLVLVHRWRPVPDVCLVVGVVLLAVVVGLVAIAWSAWSALVVGVLVLWFDLGLVVVLLGRAAGGFVGAGGRGTPPGPRWFIGGLAQRPGTRLTAVLLAKDLVARLPAGSVLVATASTQDQVERYVRLGFTATTRRRVHRTAP